MTDLNVWEKYVRLQRNIGNMLIKRNIGKTIYSNGVVWLSVPDNATINNFNKVEYYFSDDPSKIFRSSLSNFVKEFKKYISPNDEIDKEYRSVFDLDRASILDTFAKIQSNFVQDSNSTECIKHELYHPNDNVPVTSTLVDFDLTMSGMTNKRENVIIRGKPLFIAVDGGDAVGKTTICRYINQLLLDADKPSVCALGHAHGEFGQLVRSTILNDLTANTSHTTQLLLFMANRRHIYENVVKPALQKGKIAIVDRWHLTSYAYQCNAVNFDTLVMGTTEECIPDINFVLLADKDISKKRIIDRNQVSDHLEKSALDRSDLLNAKFREGALSNKYAKSTFIIDANQSLDEVKHQVKTILSMYLDITEKEI